VFVSFHGLEGSGSYGGWCVGTAGGGPAIFFVFQAQYDDSVYVRLVLEMALFQRHHPGRQVEGVILFLDSRLDPKTEPWRRVIRVYSVADQLSELQKRTPKRPLVSVFQPLTESSDENLALNAAECYHHIVDSELDSLVKNVLADVFVSWLEQRFRDKGKQEIEEMLVGALPDLTETQSGKDLIQIGVEKGKAEGKAEGKRDSLLLVLKVRFGRLPEDILQAIVDIESVERLEALTEQALQIKSLSEFDAKA